MKTFNLKLKAGETKILPLVWLGDQDRKLKVRAILDEPGTYLKIVAIFFGVHHKFELYTSIIHQAPNTCSKTLVRGVLEGDAAAHFEGQVLIEKGAKNADGDLKGHAILLSKQARAVMIPRLEVLENEVKASHGAAVGKIDEEQIFYLMSRGLNLTQAKRMIIQGFLNALLPELPSAQALKVMKTIGTL
jgi:Fe-S cluster assembly scaffold protein SufB